MRIPWKWIGLAGLAGVAATGVVVTRRRRAQQQYSPEELRSKLHQRLAEAESNERVASGN
jgi:LPXTG-motif cell wall-anchored protein